MTFEEVDRLTDEVCAFLLSRGGVYQHITVNLQENIIFCLATGQYLLYRDKDGNIDHFLYYWKIRPEDVELVMDDVEPQEKVHGTVLYIVGHGNKGGCLRTAIKELRSRCKASQGLLYNHKGAGMRYFPRQKGA